MPFDPERGVATFDSFAVLGVPAAPDAVMVPRITIAWLFTMHA
jgi:hypothetical protein